MSIESFSPLPLTTFGSWLTLLDPSDVPPGMSPSCSDVEFFPGGVRTRPGLVSQYTPLGGSPAINGLKTFATTNLVQRLLALDSIGILYKETSPGVLSIVAQGSAPGLYLASTTHFGREYMAFSDGLVGQDMPRQFDDTNFDRVSQVGPGEGPAVADATDPGDISPGVHQCAVVFVTRQGYWTAPSPAVSWTAAGSKKVNVTNIPTGPSNVVQRLLTFTAEGGADFYHVPATMIFNDNTTTSVEVDFSDTILLSGVSMDYLFRRSNCRIRSGWWTTPNGFSGGASAPRWTTGATSRLTADGTPRATAARSAGNSIRRLGRAEAARPRMWFGATRIASPRMASTLNAG